MDKVRIEGVHHQRVKVELWPSEVIEAAIKILRKKYSLEGISGLDENGQMYENVEYATSHSWIDKEDRGEPTPPQKKALNVIAWLKEGRYDE